MRYFWLCHISSSEKKGFMSPPHTQREKSLVNSKLHCVLLCLISFSMSSLCSLTTPLHFHPSSQNLLVLWKPCCLAQGDRLTVALLCNICVQVFCLVANIRPVLGNYQSIHKWVETATTTCKDASGLFILKERKTTGTFKERTFHFCFLTTALTERRKFIFNITVYKLLGDVYHGYNWYH